MRIAVTGASGFIGTELLAEMSNRGHIVAALTREESTHVDSSCCMWRETDYSVESLVSVFDDADVIVHLAGVRGTTSNPDDYIINEEITGNILKGMRAARVKRIVFASTISVYDDVNMIPWKEDGPLKGRTMYGESKIQCESMIREQADESDYTYGIARIAQVLGLGEKRRGMMNVFLDTARDGGEIRVIGKSEARRQYVYVDDLVKILAELAEIEENIIVNAGMPNAYTNLEIAEIVNRVYDNKTPIKYDDSTPEAIRSSYMDIRKLRETLGYDPMDMEKAIRDICLKQKNY